MPRARCQYRVEMRDRFEIGLTSSVDRHRATDEEKASLTEAQVRCKLLRIYQMKFKSVNLSTKNGQFIDPFSR